MPRVQGHRGQRPAALLIACGFLRRSLRTRTRFHPATAPNGREGGAHRCRQGRDGRPSTRACSRCSPSPAIAVMLDSVWILLSASSCGGIRNAQHRELAGRQRAAQPRARRIEAEAAASSRRAVLSRWTSSVVAPCGAVAMDEQRPSQDGPLLQAMAPRLRMKSRTPLAMPVPATRGCSAMTRRSSGLVRKPVSRIAAGVAGLTACSKRPESNA